MPLTNKELLAKANLETSDFGGAGEAPLTVEQVMAFLRIAITPQDMLPDVRTVTSGAAQWQESKLEFGSRIMRPGVEMGRLAEGDRVKPTTGMVEMITVLLRGEVPVSDEVMEDQVERAGFSTTLTAMIAEAVGRDIEELFIQGDENSGDPYLAQTDGWLVLSRGAGGHVYDAASDGQDYRKIFKTLLQSLPDQFKRDKANMRYYVPTSLEERYRDSVANRATALGDQTLEGTRPMSYQGILIKPVAQFPVAAGSPDVGSILLCHRSNLYAGYRRQIRLEPFRDPREGGTSWTVTSRVDPEVAVVEATAIADNVDIEPS